MHKIIICALLYLLSYNNAQSQSIAGAWHGMLKIQGMSLRLSFNISMTDTGIKATMDSHDQGAKDIPCDKANFKDASLNIEITNARISYQGILKGDSIIEGKFNQAGQSFPLNLTKNSIEKIKAKRPQEPSKPYPYQVEEISFENKKENISLAGTLTLPKNEGVFPAVILISGSGPQNRDEELLGHKPFLIIADYLTRNGIAVLRYDDRGVGKSKGNFKNATSVDFATDAESAVEYLKTRKEINKKQIGLIGHSEGGIIAPMVASRNSNVAFIVLLAGTGLPGDQILLLQQKLIASANGVDQKEIESSELINKKIFETIKLSNNTEKLKADVNKLLIDFFNDSTRSIPKGVNKNQFIAMQVSQVSSNWMQYFIKHDPRENLSKVKCPTLALNGKKDLQVPSTDNLNAIKEVFKKSGNKDLLCIEYDNLNHLFQECKTGSPSEYGEIEQTFSTDVLHDMHKWIKLHLKK